MTISQPDGWKTPKTIVIVWNKPLRGLLTHDRSWPACLVAHGNCVYSLATSMDIVIGL